MWIKWFFLKTWKFTISKIVKLYKINCMINEDRPYQCLVSILVQNEYGYIWKLFDLL